MASCELGSMAAIESPRCRPSDRRPWLSWLTLASTSALVYWRSSLSTMASFSGLLAARLQKLSIGMVLLRVEPQKPRRVLLENEGSHLVTEWRSLEVGHPAVGGDHRM